jgi:hypothetical protein
MAFWELIITVVITIVGWYIAFYFGKRQDAINKRKEMRINYLIGAYRQLEFSLHRDSSAIKNMESPIADIQLFGSKKQIKLAQEISKTFANTKSVDVKPLLLDLREDLRNELDLEKVDDVLLHFRYSETDFKIKNNES